jgi:hypothetical protein
LVERVLCKHEVVGSIPSGSTILAINRKHTEFPPILWLAWV